MTGTQGIGKGILCISVIQLHGGCSATYCKILIMGKAPNLPSFPFHSNFDNISFFLTFCTLWIFKKFCITSNKFIAKNTQSHHFWYFLRNQIFVSFFHPFKLLMHFLLLPSHYEQPASCSQKYVKQYCNIFLLSYSHFVKLLCLVFTDILILQFWEITLSSQGSSHVLQ